MSYALNHLQGRAQIAAAQTGANRFGLVTSYNPHDHTVSIDTLDVDEDGQPVVAKDVPITTMAAGSTSMRYAPAAGQMAFYSVDSHDSDSKVVTGFGHSDLNRPSDSVQLQPGEFLLSTDKGFSLHVAADGSISITAQKAAVTIQTTSWTGDINLDGRLVATGNVESQADIKDKSKTLDDLRQTFDRHTHVVQGLGGQTKPPTQQD